MHWETGFFDFPFGSQTKQDYQKFICLYIYKGFLIVAIFQGGPYRMAVKEANPLVFCQLHCL
jgi:hypothetical protein